MTFEQHPEIFFSIAAVISVAGGWAGSMLREIVRNRRERRWNL